MSAVFIRLLAEEDKGAALERAIQSVRAGDPDSGLVYRVDSAAFGEIHACRNVAKAFGNLGHLRHDEGRKGLVLRHPDRFQGGDENGITRVDRDRLRLFKRKSSWAERGGVGRAYPEVISLSSEALNRIGVYLQHVSVELKLIGAENLFQIGVRD